jgi:hypothetical protein
MKNDDFQKELTRIGNLYEKGKDLISNSIDPTKDEFWQLRDILQELRDAAASNLAALHQPKKR